MKKNKNALLIIIILVLMAASALLLYRGFSGEPLTIVPTTVSEEDVVIRNQIDRLDVKISRSIRKVEEGGALDELVESEQFQELSTDSMKPIIIGPTGRSNPFLPIPRGTGLVTP